MKENLNAIVALLGLGLFLFGLVQLWGYGVASLFVGTLLMSAASWRYLYFTIMRMKKG